MKTQLWHRTTTPGEWVFANYKIERIDPEHWRVKWKDQYQRFARLYEAKQFVENEFILNNACRPLTKN